MDNNNTQALIDFVTTNIKTELLNNSLSELSFNNNLVAVPQGFEIVDMSKHDDSLDYEFKNSFTTTNIESWIEYINAYKTELTPKILIDFSSQDIRATLDPSRPMAVRKEKSHAYLELKSSNDYCIVKDICAKPAISKEHFINFLHDMENIKALAEDRQSSIQIMDAMIAVKNLTVEKMLKRTDSETTFNRQRSEMENITVSSHEGEFPHWLLIDLPRFKETPSCQALIQVKSICKKDDKEVSFKLRFTRFEKYINECEKAIKYMVKEKLPTCEIFIM